MFINVFNGKRKTKKNILFILFKCSNGLQKILHWFFLRRVLIACFFNERRWHTIFFTHILADGRLIMENCQTCKLYFQILCFHRLYGKYVEVVTELKKKKFQTCTRYNRLTDRPNSSNFSIYLWDSRKFLFSRFGKDIRRKKRIKINSHYGVMFVHNFNTYDKWCKTRQSDAKCQTASVCLILRLNAVFAIKSIFSRHSCNRMFSGISGDVKMNIMHLMWFIIHFNT